MSQGDADEDKQYEATQKKLDDARKKGELARSADLTTAGSYLGLVVVASLLGSRLLPDVGADLVGLLTRAPAYSTQFFEAYHRNTIALAFQPLLFALLPFFVVPGVLALFFVVAQKALVVAPSKLQPKLTKISPIANAKNKFGRRGLFEFIKSFAKLLIFCVILGWFLFSHAEELLIVIWMQPQQVTALMAELTVEFLGLIFVVTLCLGGVDFLWQRQEHLRRHRMSHKELLDETKQSEGDPHIKQQRRQKAQEIAASSAMADVPGADVVIVNPTHYAIALRWQRTPGSAPVCVAKGKDQMAARIRKIAQEAGVPIRHDPPTARALFATTNIGEEIAPDHYRAVAAAIRFAETLRKKAVFGGSA